MAKWIISLKNFFKLIPKSWIPDANVFTKVELIVEISFETFGQVQYQDESGRPWIKEFKGSKWVKELYFRELRDVGFSVFINNQYLKKEKFIKLIKKIDDKIVHQIEYQLSGNKLFEGWFKL